VVYSCANLDAGDPGHWTSMERNNRTKSTKPTTYLRKDIGSIPDGKHPNNQQRATKHHDPVMEELERMSNDGKKNSSHNEPGKGWLAIDRSRQVDADCTWDGIAYMGTRESDGEKRHEYQQRRSGSTTSSSMIVERGSNA
jgi:hypothetical protein